MTAFEWNSKYPVGTPVRYRPFKDQPGCFRDTVTSRPARNVANGHPVVALKCERGSKSLLSLEVLSSAAAAESGVGS